MRNTERTFVLWFCSGLAVVTLMSFAVFGWFVSRGIDGYFPKLIQRSQHSLVLGTSYAARGVVPSILNKMGLGYEGPLFNFAFTNPWSPWGPAYLSAIKEMVEPGTTRGLFLLQVNPRSFVVVRKAQDKERFMEDRGPLARFQEIRTWGPLVYAHDYLDAPLWRVVLDEVRGRPQLRTDADGWVFGVRTRTTEELKSDYASNMAKYRDDLQTRVFSEIRWDYFVQTIQFLSRHGSVVLLRLPSTDEYVVLDDQLSLGFDARVEALAGELGIAYLNFKGDHGGYKTVDGAHLMSESARAFTEELGQSLSMVLNVPQGISQFK